MEWVGRMSFLDDKEFFEAVVKLVIKLGHGEVSLYARHFNAITGFTGFGMQQQGDQVGCERPWGSP